MARFVTFNGQTIFKPGGLTRINANALAPIGLSATGILGIIGEADAGVPHELVTIDDPALATQVFGSGPLADAVNIAFNPSGDPRVPGGAFRVIAYKTNASTHSETSLPGSTALIADTAAAGSTTTAVNLTTGGLTLNAHVGRWLLSNGVKRRIVSNTASSITVSPGFSAAPAVASAVSILDDEMLLTSRNYGVDQNQISVEFEPGVTADTFVITTAKGAIVNQSPELGGTPFLTLQYIGGAVPASGSGTITVATTSQITFTPALVPALNAFAGMLIQFYDGTQRLVLSNTAATPCDIVLDAAQYITTAQASDFVGTDFTIRDVSSADATIAGANGVATGLTTVVAPVADNLNITFAPGQTLRQLVDFINATTNYRAGIPNGVNPDTTLMGSFDFDARATNVDVRFDQLIDPVNKGNFRRDLQVAVDWINSFSTLASCVRASAGVSEGAGIPAFTGGVSATIQDSAVYFIGGSRGFSASSDFQNGFDAFLQVRVNNIVPLISQDLVNEGFGSTAKFAAVAAQLSDHVKQCAGIARSERGGYIGMKGTKSQLLAQASSLNNTDVQLFGQQLTVLDAQGNLVLQPEWSIAVTAAGMRCGVPEVGEPLTFKFINTTALSQDSSWSPRSITDVNALIQGGVMFAEQPPQGGFRFVRDETTYLVDDNIAFLDGNTRDAVRYVAYDLRTELENDFTGLKAKPATVQNIRSTVVAKMELYRQQSIIVDSLDPETKTKILPGYRNLRVYVSGNVANIKVEIFPVTGILFQLSDIYLQLPTLTA